jgi:hypothetical protein
VGGVFNEQILTMRILRDYCACGEMWWVLSESLKRASAFSSA